MNIQFNQFYKAISGVFPIPDEVTELCRLTEEQYKAIYNSFPSFDQCIIDEKIDATKECVRKIGVLREIGVRRDTEVKNLVGIAVENLLVIRNYQNVRRLTDRFPEKAEYFYLHRNIPQYRDVFARLLTLAPATFSHLTFGIGVLIPLKPEDRRAVMGSLGTLIALCENEDHVQSLSIFLATTHNTASFINNLTKLLVHVPPQEWPNLFQALPRGARELLVQSIARFLRPCFLSRDVVRLLPVMEEFRHDPQALYASLPLVERCSDGECVADIVHVVAHVPDRIRDNVVASVLAHLDEHHPSAAIMGVVTELLLAQLLRGLHLGEPTPDFTINRTDFRKCPEKLLRDFVAFIGAEKRESFVVKFVGEPAIDAGGPGREFLYQLTKAIAERHFRLCDNGLYKDAKVNPELLSDLGQLFMFCLESGEYRIGMQFDHSLFVAIGLLQSGLNIQMLPHASEEHLFQLYEALYSHEEAARNALVQMKIALSEARETIIEALEATIAPAQEILNGMKRYPHAKPPLLAADALEAHIQGNVTPEQLIGLLHYDENVSQEMRGWLERWILEMSHIKMKKFLSYITGTAGLGSKKIIVSVKGEVLKATTCTLELCMPKYACEIEMRKQLEAAMENEQSFSTR
ncbi:MAG: hypothetical protein JSS12_03545 [Verrucomicrobia bacterium]|nr:hypothetical protein [Verrucomicrobiota bacterium]